MTALPSSNTRNQIAASRTLSAGRKARNVGMGLLIGLATALVVAPLILIFGFLLVKGLGALNLDFFIKTPAPEGETGGGWANAISGSLLILSMAAVIGVGVGVAGGVFLSEYPRHRLMPVIRSLSDVLSGIPAIVMGLVVYALMVRPHDFGFFQTQGGFSALAGAVALGLLMVPIVVRTTEEVMKLVPLSVREAGLALGLPQWKVILAIVLPAARGGIVTGVMLALARVAGEAAPLLFTAFGSNLVAFSQVGQADSLGGKIGAFFATFSQPASALPLEIFKGATSSYPENQRLAQAGALFLITLIFVTSLLARYASRQRK